MISIKDKQSGPEPEETVEKTQEETNTKFCKDNEGLNVILVYESPAAEKPYKGFPKTIEKVGRKYMTVGGQKYNLTDGKSPDAEYPRVITKLEAIADYGDDLVVAGETEKPPTETAYISGCLNGKWHKDKAKNCNQCANSYDCMSTEGSKQRLIDNPDQIPEYLVTGERVMDLDEITEGDWSHYHKPEIVSGCEMGEWYLFKVMNCNNCLHREECPHIRKMHTLKNPDQEPTLFVTGEKVSDYQIQSSKVDNDDDIVFITYKKIETESEDAEQEEPVEAAHPEQVEASKPVAEAKQEVKKQEKLINPVDAIAADGLKRLIEKLKAEWEGNESDLKKIERKVEKLTDEKFFCTELRERLESEIQNARNNYFRFCAQHEIEPKLSRITADDQLELPFNKKASEEAKAAEKQEETKKAEPGQVAEEPKAEEEAKQDTEPEETAEKAQKTEPETEVGAESETEKEADAEVETEAVSEAEAETTDEPKTETSPVAATEPEDEYVPSEREKLLAEKIVDAIGRDDVDHSVDYRQNCVVITKDEYFSSNQDDLDDAWAELKEVSQNLQGHGYCPEWTEKPDFNDNSWEITIKLDPKK